MNVGVAFGLEVGVADRSASSTIDVGVRMGANRESETRRHAGRIHFQRLIEELANVGEGRDLN